LLSRARCFDCFNSVNKPNVFNSELECNVSSTSSGGQKPIMKAKQTVAGRLVLAVLSTLTLQSSTVLAQSTASDGVPDLDRAGCP
jgi:hypothetical protein